MANITRHYAPNARFVYRDTQDERGYSADNPSKLNIVNAAVGVENLDGQDRLPVDQSRALRDDSTGGRYAALLVWAAGNLTTALPGDDPANAIPAIRANAFVESYAERGWLHAKSALVVVGAVDHRAADDGWVLSHESGGHSPRAGVARHAFIVAPDDNRASSFTGTSFELHAFRGRLPCWRRSVRPSPPSSSRSFS